MGAPHVVLKLRRPAHSQPTEEKGPVADRDRVQLSIYRRCGTSVGSSGPCTDPTPVIFFFWSSILSLPSSPEMRLKCSCPRAHAYKALNIFRMACEISVGATCFLAFLSCVFLFKASRCGRRHPAHGLQRDPVQDGRALPRQQGHGSVRLQGWL